MTGKKPEDRICKSDSGTGQSLDILGETPSRDGTPDAEGFGDGKGVADGRMLQRAAAP